MVIRTKEFTFTKQQYFGILFRNILSKSWWAIGFLIVIFIYQLYKTEQHPAPVMVNLILGALPVIFFSYLALRAWLHATAKKNRLFYAERVFEIDNQSLTIYFKNGTVNKILITDIVRVIKNLKYYRLFLSKKQFIFLPLDVFQRVDDINRFDAILKARRK